MLQGKIKTKENGPSPGRLAEHRAPRERPEQRGCRQAAMPPPTGRPHPKKYPLQEGSPRPLRARYCLQDEAGRGREIAGRRNRVHSTLRRLQPLSSSAEISPYADNFLFGRSFCVEIPYLPCRNLELTFARAIHSIIWRQACPARGRISG